jgi:hypothetical protein
VEIDALTDELFLPQVSLGAKRRVWEVSQEKVWPIKGAMRMDNRQSGPQAGPVCVLRMALRSYFGLYCNKYISMIIIILKLKSK